MDDWLAISTDGGRHFRMRRRLAGPFDASLTPYEAVAGTRSYFLGDYQGIAALKHGFVTAFAVSTASGTAIRVARVVLH